jgi:two-component system, LuxR family, sensor kinase FixL
MDQATQWEEKLAACREDLEASNARFRNTIENNADGILIVDMQGIVRFANPAAGAIFGQDPETLVDREFGFPMVTGGKAEVDLIRSPGETLTAEMRVTQTRWEDAPCRLVSLRDITERKQAEQDLEAYAADLARSNAELQRFAFVASHHLQEPLRTVVLHLQLLERRCRDQLDAKARTSIDYAVAGASHMRELIGDLLSYSQVDKRDIEFTPVDCTCVLAQTLDALQAQIAASEAEVTYDDLPTVDADKIQLRQVFEQLIENAIKFRREGVPPRVHVAAREGGRGRGGVGLLDHRQRHRHRPRLLRTHLRPLLAAAHPGGVPGHRDRIGPLQEDRGTAPRADVDRLETG